MICGIIRRGRELFVKSSLLPAPLLFQKLQKNWDKTNGDLLTFHLKSF
jgi:hypothetical protein